MLSFTQLSTKQADRGRVKMLQLSDFKQLSKQSTQCTQYFIIYHHFFSLFEPAVLVSKHSHVDGLSVQILKTAFC